MKEKVYFDCDYQTGAHPEVLAALVAGNETVTPGYGKDAFCDAARARILEECRLPDGEVFFMSGGTQTNATVIDRLIRRGEGVVCAESGHINVHEAGAIESCGHKVLTLPSHQGRIDAAELRHYISDFYADDTWEHMVRPAMVYISYTTELGTLYTRQELTDIYKVCFEHNIPLYIDGARLAYGLAAGELTLPELAQLCDVFYIGGTKCGTLFGEAVVARRKSRLRGFLTHAKSHGALLAKGRLLGQQFGALFADGLYYRIGEQAVKLALALKREFTERGFRLLIDSPTNQQFFVLPNQVLDSLAEHVSFELWGPRGETETAVRFVTGWSTTEADILAVAECLDTLSPKNR